MTIHYCDDNTSQQALCGAPVAKFRINVVSVWNMLEGSGLFVNCPECLVKRPPKRKRMEGFDRGKKFR